MTDDERQVAEDILNGPDYFTCDRMTARMKKTRCVERQERAAAAMAKRFDVRDLNTFSTTRMRLEKCVNCEQGQEIRKAGRK